MKRVSRSTIVEIYLVVKTLLPNFPSFPIYNSRNLFGRENSPLTPEGGTKSTIVETDGTRFTNTKKKRNAVKHQKFSE